MKSNDTKGDLFLVWKGILNIIVKIKIRKILSFGYIKTKYLK